jgi:hypothetical protein
MYDIRKQIILATAMENSIYSLLNNSIFWKNDSKANRENSYNISLEYYKSDLTPALKDYLEDIELELISPKNLLKEILIINNECKSKLSNDLQYVKEFINSTTLKMNNLNTCFHDINLKIKNKNRTNNVDFDYERIKTDVLEYLFKVKDTSKQIGLSFLGYEEYKETIITNINNYNNK